MSFFAVPTCRAILVKLESKDEKDQWDTRFMHTHVHVVHFVPVFPVDKANSCWPARMAETHSACCHCLGISGNQGRDWTQRCEGTKGFEGSTRSRRTLRTRWTSCELQKHETYQKICAHHFMCLHKYYIVYIHTSYNFNTSTSRNTSLFRHIQILMYIPDMTRMAMNPCTGRSWSSWS